MNIAEQHHRIRLRRLAVCAPSARTAIETTIEQCIQAGASAESLYDAVCGLRVEMVLTAHPTQALRRTLLQKPRRVAALLARRDRTDLARHEREEIVADLRREVIALWQTDELRRRKPTPVDEARAGLVLSIRCYGTRCRATSASFLARCATRRDASCPCAPCPCASDRFVPDELRPLGQELRASCERTIAGILRARGDASLLAHDPELRRNLELRNQYVDPLNLLQAELLRRNRENEDPRLADALLVTINGIAAGMRNTG